MPNKVKLSPEEKVKAVQGYLSGALSMSDFEQQYNLSRQSLNVWVRLYEGRGAEGLIPASKQASNRRKYAPALKRKAVEDYLAGEPRNGAFALNIILAIRKRCESG